VENILPEIEIEETVSVKKEIPLWRRSISLNIGFGIVVFILLLSFFPGWVATHDPSAQNYETILKPPSLGNFFGTDNYGRDMFSRVIWGTRVDLVIGVVATIVPLITGSLLGLLAGYYGGWIDLVTMRLLDIIMALPFMVLIIAIVAIIGPGIMNLYIAIWMVGWKYYTRLVRAEVLVAKNAEYIQAAKVLGYSDLRIILRHILPNVISVAIVFAAADVVMCMLAGASMSFLGLGVQPPTPEWGALIAGGRAYISSAWWMTAFPGLFLVIAGTGFSMLGDGLADMLRTKGR
jgi:peptide/nickel transport system permease protein